MLSLPMGSVNIRQLLVLPPRLFYPLLDGFVRYFILHSNTLGVDVMLRAILILLQCRIEGLLINGRVLLQDAVTGASFVGVVALPLMVAP